MGGRVATFPRAPMAEPRCCCTDWIADLARAHARRLAGVARREGLAPGDALDAVQEAFQTLLGRPDLPALRARPTAGVVRLLTTITRNAARNLRRRHHRARPHVELDGVALATDAPTPVEALVTATETAQLVGCLAALGDVHRHVVTLRVLEELSSDEAARVSGEDDVRAAVSIVARLITDGWLTGAVSEEAAAS